MSKHTIEKIDSYSWILDDTIIIKYIEQLGNDNGWCVFNEGSFYQKVYDNFEDALLIAIGKKKRKPQILTPPAG